MSRRKLNSLQGQRPHYLSEEEFNILLETFPLELEELSSYQICRIFQFTSRISAAAASEARRDAEEEAYKTAKRMVEVLFA